MLSFNTLQDFPQTISPLWLRGWPTRSEERLRIVVDASAEAEAKLPNKLETPSARTT